MRSSHSVLLLCVLAACRGHAPGPELLALDGTRHQPLAACPGSVHVVVFLSHECPIANAYAPELRALAERTRGQPVHWYLVHVDPDVTAAAAREHAANFALPGTVLLDPGQDLVRALGASRTPEVFVLTAADGGPWQVAYQGRIDDLWQGFGARAQTASTHELRDALDAVIAGRPVAVPRTEAVGCLLPAPRR